MQKAIERVELRYAAQAVTRRNLLALILLTALLLAVTAACAVALAAPAVLFIRSQPQDTQGTWLQMLSAVLELALLIPVCGLSAGYIRTLMDLAQGRQVGALALFGQMKRCLRGAAVYLLIMLRMALKLAAAAALVVAASLLADLFPARAVENVLMTASFIAAGCIVLPALLQYALAFHVLSDDGTCSATECVLKSRRIMTGNRWHLCCLMGRYGLVMLGAMLATALLLGGLLNGLFSNETITLVFTVVWTICAAGCMLQEAVALTCFYLKYRPAGEATDAVAAPETAQFSDEKEALEAARPEAVPVVPDADDRRFRVGGDE